jgi:rhomboid protease GluP
MDAIPLRFLWQPLFRYRKSNSAAYARQGEILPPADSPAYHPDPYLNAPPPQQRREGSGRGFSAAPATYVLLGINIAVFLLMVLSGVSTTNPTVDQLLHWGANIGYADYLQPGPLQGEWWRLVTAMFVHSGILHIATNMWCLWNLGLLGEQLVGPMGVFSVYLLTGAAGNLLSTSLSPTSVGVGASGAVFGIAGLLIVLLSNKNLPVPPAELSRLRRSVIYFALINFVIGYGANYAANQYAFGIRIDNSAHLGGCLCGLALGVPLLPRMLAGKQKYLARQRITFAAAAFILALMGYWIANFRGV